MVEIVLSIVASVVSGITLFLLKKYFDKAEKREEEQHRTQARENVLILKSINAIGKLTMANSICLRDGKTNGEMHDAMDSYNEVHEELYEYLLDQNSKKN